MRKLILGQPVGTIDWDTSHRLMLKSFLEDGAYARLAYKNRFGCFCSQMEACLKTATKAGDAVPSPAGLGNRALFAYHVGAWLALTRLPSDPAIDYRGSREDLLNETVWFALRGMGLTDKAIATHYNPRALALSYSAV